MTIVPAHPEAEASTDNHACSAETLTRDYVVSDLTRIRPTDDETLPRKLSRGIITQYHHFTSFGGLQRHVLMALRSSRPNLCKEDSYGWTATCFTESWKTFKAGTPEEYTRLGRWRNGENEIDACTVAIFDIDNDNRDKTRAIVTPEQVSGILDITHFTYTSFSHTPSKPKFRLVVDTTRPISREENLTLAVWFNEHVFGKQADLSIYDPSDFLYAPPHHTSMTTHQGSQLDPDSIIEAVNGQPGLLSIVERLRCSPPKKPTYVPTLEEQAASAERLANTVSSGVTISDPAIWNPAWTCIYAAHLGGHWHTMRSLLGSVWLKSSGTLSRGDMEDILAQIDEECAGYFARKYAKAGIDELINFTMSRSVPPYDSRQKDADVRAALARLRSKSTFGPSRPRRLDLEF